MNSYISNTIYLSLLLLLLLLVIVSVAHETRANDELAKCIDELEQVYLNFKIPQSIERYADTIWRANPELERLSDAPKLNIKAPNGERPIECRDLIDDTMELIIGVPCYYTFANPNNVHFERYRKAKIESRILERVFGAAAICAL